jgi:transposase
VSSLYPKKVNGKTYWYLRTMARVDGKPKMVSERYLGSAADVAAAFDAGATAVMPERTRHLAFGDIAAVWAMCKRLNVIDVIDEITGGSVAGAPCTIGTYLAIAVCSRITAPCSKARIADWWAQTAADRFTKIRATDLDHRRFWDAMHAVSVDQLEQISQLITAAMITEFGLDTTALALDMTNFATYIASANTKAPIAQRGKAKQKRTDLRLVGLGLVITRDGGVPLTWHAYPGNKPDVTQFPTMIDTLTARYRALGTDTAAITVVFDAGQNSAANFAHLTATGMHYVGSTPPSDHPDLLDLPASRRRPVPGDRFAGVTALQTRKQVYGIDQRVVLTHSPSLHEAQERGLTQTLAAVGRALDELAATLARGHTRRDRTQVEASIAHLCSDTWVQQIISCQLRGDTPADFRLTWALDNDARDALTQRVFGKRILITDREDWTAAEVIDGYRSQSDAEFGFRQLKDPHEVSFSPMHHYTDHTITVHTFTCVLALQIAHLMRREANAHGHHLSVRELLTALAGIEETVLIYPSTGGRPKARRMLTETTTTQTELAQIFGLDRYTPAP